MLQGGQFQWEQRTPGTYTYDDTAMFNSFNKITALQIISKLLGPLPGAHHCRSPGEGAVP